MDNSGKTRSDERLVGEDYRGDSPSYLVRPLKNWEARQGGNGEMGQKLGVES